jgi:hypothetical protein
MTAELVLAALNMALQLIRPYLSGQLRKEAYRQDPHAAVAR